MSKLATLKKKGMDYTGVATLIEDKEAGTQFIVVAPNHELLFRVCSRMSKLMDREQLNSNHFAPVKVSSNGTIS